KGECGHIDVFTAGQVIVHGRHREGCEVSLDVLDMSELTLAGAPAWAVEIVRGAAAKAPAPPRPAGDDDEAPVRLNEQATKIWRGEIVVAKGGGIVDAADSVDVDRSESLFLLGQNLAQAGAARKTIITALAGRDVALGYSKFNGRRDEGMAEYERI